MSNALFYATPSVSSVNKRIFNKSRKSSTVIIAFCGLLLTDLLARCVAFGHNLKCYRKKGQQQSDQQQRSLSFHTLLREIEDDDEEKAIKYCKIWDWVNVTSSKHLLLCSLSLLLPCPKFGGRFLS